MCDELGTPGGRCFLDTEKCPFAAACAAALAEKFRNVGLWLRDEEET